MRTINEFVHKGSRSSRWSGAKHVNDPSRCVFSVYEPGRAADWHQCQRKPVETIEEHGFCKLHVSVVKDKLGISEAKNIRYAAAFYNGEPKLAELQVVSETPKTINIKSVKELMGSLIGLYSGSQRKDSQYINGYEFFDAKEDAVRFLLGKAVENVEWHERELDRANVIHGKLLDEWHKEAV